jgi:hypothetical protein
MVKGSFIRCRRLRDQPREVFRVPGGDDPVTWHLPLVP